MTGLDTASRCRRGTASPGGMLSRDKKSQLTTFWTSATCAAGLPVDPVEARNAVGKEEKLFITRLLLHRLYEIISSDLDPSRLHHRAVIHDVWTSVQLVANRSATRKIFTVMITSVSPGLAPKITLYGCLKKVVGACHRLRSGKRSLYGARRASPRPEIESP
jgi:hypothetical protein